MAFCSPAVQNAAQTLYKPLLSLTIYRGVCKRPVTSLLLGLLRTVSHGDEEGTLAAWGALCAALAADGRLDSLPSAVAREVLIDENPFVSQLLSCRHTDCGTVSSEPLAKLAQRDLAILWRAATVSPADLLGSIPPDMASAMPEWGTVPAPAPLDGPWEQCLDALAKYHGKNGCGAFVSHKAFLWRKGGMLPVEHPDPIRLSNLKGYEYQRRIAIDNTRAFLDGYEANNMLLYGDRGTGKSSTVKALLNEYAGEGLRMIEMPKEYLNQLPDLTGYLSVIPMKFIIFIDDLSFADNDDNFAALKAVLEGGLSSRPDNVVIYATSNRRHLLRETFSNRSGDEVHQADTVQEAVSLSDRFGISLTFLMPDKQRFLEIVEQIAADHGLKADRQALLNAAERWALERGARSPRYARQFIADAQARLARGETL